ncbi:MAG: hypothetical protein Q9198_006989 [Flavoplaca austrocitrina]
MDPIVKRPFSRPRQLQLPSRRAPLPKGRVKNPHPMAEIAISTLESSTASNPVRPREDQQQHPPLKGEIAISTLESSLPFLLMLSVRRLTSLLSKALPRTRRDRRRFIGIRCSVRED